MLYIRQHIQQIVENYQGAPPLAAWLKIYFKQNPKLGSRDRRAITTAIYTYYRTVLFFENKSNIFSIITCGLNVTQAENALLSKIFKDEKIETIGSVSAVEKYKTIRFSNDINATTWCKSMLSQPSFFIRIVSNEKLVLSQLKEALVKYKIVPTPIANQICIALPNGFKAEEILQPNNYIVQDWASQSSLQLALQAFLPLLENKSLTAWDVCSGAGGKSLLLKSILPKSKILATDIRSSILENYKKRMRYYGYHDFEIMLIDAAKDRLLQEKLKNKSFDFIICDVPCSGSGTWARTPEQFYFFDTNAIEQFSNLQFQIASNALQYLNKEGLFCYITCSVFEAENENIVNRIMATQNVKCLSQQLINGISQKADSMFVAVFQKK